MISIEMRGQDSILAEFRDYTGKTTRAMIRALNRAIAAARTVMVREIARDTGIKQADVRDAIRMQEATFGRPQARLAASIDRIPLIDFQARGPVPSRGRGHGVSYRLERGRERNPHAFIATMRSGHRGVFMRLGRTRLPITELHGPSLGHVFAKHRPAGLARAQEMFEKTFDHELEFRRSSDGGGSE